MAPKLRRMKKPTFDGSFEGKVDGNCGGSFEEKPTFDCSFEGWLRYRRMNVSEVTMPPPKLTPSKRAVTLRALAGLIERPIMAVPTDVGDSVVTCASCNNMDVPITKLRWHLCSSEHIDNVLARRMRAIDEYGEQKACGGEYPMDTNAVRTQLILAHKMRNKYRAAAMKQHGVKQSAMSHNARRSFIMGM